MARDAFVMFTLYQLNRDSGTDQWIPGNLIYTLRPDLYASGVLPRGNPHLEKLRLTGYNTEKFQRILGLRLRGVEEVVIRILADFEARGWIEPKQ